MACYLVSYTTSKNHAPVNIEAVRDDGGPTGEFIYYQPSCYYEATIYTATYQCEGVYLPIAPSVKAATCGILSFSGTYDTASRITTITVTAEGTKPPRKPQVPAFMSTRVAAPFVSLSTNGQCMRFTFAGEVVDAGWPGYYFSATTQVIGENPIIPSIGNIFAVTQESCNASGNTITCTTTAFIIKGTPQIQLQDSYIQFESVQLQDWFTKAIEEAREPKPQKPKTFSITKPQTQKEEETTPPPPPPPKPSEEGEQPCMFDPNEPPHGLIDRNPNKIDICKPYVSLTKPATISQLLYERPLEETARMCVISDNSDPNAVTHIEEIYETFKKDNMKDELENILSTLAQNSLASIKCGTDIERARIIYEIQNSGSFRLYKSGCSKLYFFQLSSPQASTAFLTGLYAEPPANLDIHRVIKLPDIPPYDVPGHLTRTQNYNVVLTVSGYDTAFWNLVEQRLIDDMRWLPVQLVVVARKGCETPTFSIDGTTNLRRFLSLCEPASVLEALLKAQAYTAWQHNELDNFINLVVHLVDMFEFTQEEVDLGLLDPGVVNTGQVIEQLAAAYTKRLRGRRDPISDIEAVLSSMRESGIRRGGAQLMYCHGAALQIYYNSMKYLDQYGLATQPTICMTDTTMERLKEAGLCKNC